MPLKWLTFISLVWILATFTLMSTLFNWQICLQRIAESFMLLHGLLIFNCDLLKAYQQLVKLCVWVLYCSAKQQQDFICSFSGGKKDIVLEKGREKHKFVIVFHRKVSCRESQTLLQLYSAGVKFVVIFLSIFTSLQRKAITSVVNSWYLNKKKMHFCLLHFHMCYKILDLEEKEVV